jgi:hypothetical protein
MWYKVKDGLLIGTQRPWQWDKYGVDHFTKSDVLWRSSVAAIAYGNFEFLKHTYDVIKQGKRWPDSWNSSRDARNRIDHMRSKRRYEKGRASYEKYRWQTGMTRDPYIMFWSGAKLQGWESWIERTKPPGYIYRPAFSAYRKFLITERVRDLKEFEKWEIASLRLGQKTSYPGYALHLSAWMAYMTDSEAVQNEILKMVPEWNWLVRLLCNDTDIPELFTYRSKRGYQWSSDRKAETDQWFDDSWYLDTTETYKLDKDILSAVYYMERPSY